MSRAKSRTVFACGIEQDASRAHASGHANKSISIDACWIRIGVCHGDDACRARSVNGSQQQRADTLIVGHAEKTDLHERCAGGSIGTGQAFDRGLMIGVAKCGSHRPRAAHCCRDAAQNIERDRAKRARRWILCVDEVGPTLESGLRFFDVRDADQQLHERGPTMSCSTRSKTFRRWLRLSSAAVDDEVVTTTRSRSGTTKMYWPPKPHAWYA